MPPRAQLWFAWESDEGSGGGRGIRTPERVTPLTVFKTAGFNHSPIPPSPIVSNFNRFICRVQLSLVIYALAKVPVLINDDR